MNLLEQIKIDLTSLLRVAKVQLQETSRGLRVKIADYLGDDLDSTTLQDIRDDLTEEVTDRLKTKFKITKIAEIIISNLDDEVPYETIAASGEIRDEITDMLSEARIAFYTGLDAIYQARNLMSRSLSKSLAEKLTTEVIQPLNTGDESIMALLRQIEATLYEAKVQYEE